MPNNSNLYAFCFVFFRRPIIHLAPTLAFCAESERFGFILINILMAIDKRC